MKQNPSNKRSRHHRPYNNNNNGRIRSVNTHSNHAPDPKTRAQAHKNLEKYLSLARDASASGDRVAAENYYQYADHYYRITNTGQPKPVLAENILSETEGSEENVEGAETVENTEVTESALIIDLNQTETETEDNGSTVDLVISEDTP